MDRATLARGYAQFCATQGAQMPGAAGESDIKGDARLAVGRGPSPLGLLTKYSTRAAPSSG